MKNIKRNFRAIWLFLPVFILITTSYFWQNKQREFGNSQREIITIYSKKICGYCLMAKKLLDELEINYEEIEISDKPKLQQKLIQATGQNTVPLIFIGKEFIGGYNELQQLVVEDKLFEMISSKKEGL